MGRVRRVDIGGMVYHVLNRASFRSRLFRKAAHYQAFLGIVEDRLLEWLNHLQGKEEIEKIRQAIQRNRPYGSKQWVSRAVRQFGLESATRSRGRPKKGS